MRSKKFLWGLMLAIAITVMMLPATVFADEGDEGGGWYYKYDDYHALKGKKAELEVQVLDSQTDQPFDGDIHYQWVNLEDYYNPQKIGEDSSSYIATAVGNYGCYVTVNGEIPESPVEFYVYDWTVGYYDDEVFLKGDEVKLELTKFDPGDCDNDFSYQWMYRPYGEDTEETALTEEIALKEETKPCCTATKPGEYSCYVTQLDEHGEAIETQRTYLDVYYPIEKVDITVNAPLCEQVSTTPTESYEYGEDLDTSKQTNRPVASIKTKGVKIYDAETYWVCPYTTDDNIWDISKRIQFEGGREYVARIGIETEKDYRFIDWDDVNITINGRAPIDRAWPGAYAKVKAEHYKDAGTVTKAATTTAEGVKTFKCKGCGKVLGTESIPKLPKKNTTVKKPTLTNVVANSSKKTNNPKWSKVSGATGYEIAWRLRGAKKWSTKNVGNTTQAVVAKQKMKGLYEYKVRAKKAETATTKAAVSSYSNVLYRYYYTMQKLKFKPDKKAIEVSWAKDSNATGYQILYSTSKKHKDGYGAKVITIGKNSITKKKVTGLQSGKTYYVQTRAIKKVGKTNYIGNLSSPIAVKVK